MFGSKDKKRSETQADQQAPTEQHEAHACCGKKDCCGGDPADPVAVALKERDEAVSRSEMLLRGLADAQNALRRAASNEQEARKQGAAGVLQSIIPVLDHFDMALAHALAEPSVHAVLEGVKTIRSELLRALEQHGVAPINPALNDELDPMRHAVVMNLPGMGALAGRIAATLQVGYLLGDRVIRPAKVAVAPLTDVTPPTDANAAMA